MTIEIRSARTSDYEALCRLWDQGDALHARLRPEFFRTAPGLPRTYHSLMEVLSRDHEQLIVAEVDACLAGLAHVKVFDTPDDPRKVASRRGHVDDLVVEQEYRRRGVGRALMDAAAQWCREQGARQLVLTVWAGNGPAEAFYTRLGYRPVSRVLGREL